MRRTSSSVLEKPEMVQQSIQPKGVFEETIEADTNFENLESDDQANLQGLLRDYFLGACISPKSKVSFSKIFLDDIKPFFKHEIRQKDSSDESIERGYFILTFVYELEHGDKEVREYIEACKKGYIEDSSQIVMEFADYRNGQAGFSWVKSGGLS